MYKIHKSLKKMEDGKDINGLKTKIFFYIRHLMQINDNYLCLRKKKIKLEKS